MSKNESIYCNINNNITCGIYSNMFYNCFYCVPVYNYKSYCKRYPLLKETIVVVTYRDALLQVMNDSLERPNTIIIGQGVSDPKGIFGTTLGLADKYGYDRVIDVPLSEECITGVCIGAALNGIYPINTHIRADFALVTFNQIVNLAAKYRDTYHGNFELPMMIRMVVGRSWGQGAQHSQSPQALFAHIPGLTVFMPSNAQAVLDWYTWALDYRDPVIFIEHRLLYDIRFEVNKQRTSKTILMREGRDVTIVATSIMVLETIRAAKYLEQFGIHCEVIDLNCISHPDWECIISSVEKTGRLLIADTSWRPFGVSAEVARVIGETDPGILKAPIKSVGMQFVTCPTAKVLEDVFYPSQHTLIDDIATLVMGRHSIPLPTESSMSDTYKKFKGPF